MATVSGIILIIMLRSKPFVLIALVVALAYAAIHGTFPEPPPDGAPQGTNQAVSDQHDTSQIARRAASLGLPPEAIRTLDLIHAGGPFPYRQDGTTFHNREGLLPQKPLGYYREYTVDTPGASNRGARRWVIGGDPPEVYYYTTDHYRSFRRIEPER